MNDTSTNERLDPHLPAVKIARKFGGNSAFAKAIDKAPTTTDRWLARGDIPLGAWSAVYAAARRDGVELHMRDFVDLRQFDDSGRLAKVARPQAA